MEGLFRENYVQKLLILDYDNYIDMKINGFNMIICVFFWYAYIQICVQLGDFYFKISFLLDCYEG